MFCLEAGADINGLPDIAGFACGQALFYIFINLEENFRKHLHNSVNINRF